MGSARDKWDDFCVACKSSSCPARYNDGSKCRQCHCTTEVECHFCRVAVYYKKGKALGETLKAPKEKSYETLGAEIGRLVQEKQAAYGDSFGRSGEILKILYPDGIPTSDYPEALALIRVIDKLFRIATNKDAFGESPWKDIAGYGILGAMRSEKK